jgi:hypothetical protein
MRGQLQQCQQLRLTPMTALMKRPPMRQGWPPVAASRPRVVVVVVLLLWLVEALVALAVGPRLWWRTAVP